MGAEKNGSRARWSVQEMLAFGKHCIYLISTCEPDGSSEMEQQAGPVK